MGVHQLVSNNKRTKRQKSNYAVAKSKKKVRKLKRGTPSICVQDIELLSEKQLKHKIAHPRCNITVSGKRKRKALKRLRHRKKDKMTMDVQEPVVSKAVRDAIMSEVSEKPKAVPRRSKRSTTKPADVEMTEEDQG